MKKVLRITNSLGFGGIEKVFELHGKYFDQKDYELVFVAMNQGGHTADVLRAMGYRVVILNSPVEIPSWSCLTKLVRLFREEKPDVIHTCGAEANFHGILAGYRTKVPVLIAEEIGLPSHSRTARMVYRVLYLFATRILAISDAVRDYLVQHEAATEKVVRIYNPIEINDLPVERKPLDNKIVIACLCRLAPVKNCQMLIKLIGVLSEKYPDREFALWLIGDGSERASLEQLARDSGVEGRVVFWGYQKNPTQILKDAHLFILPSFREGFGLACIEAIQSGLPVIASDAGGMKEFIKDGTNGFLFNPHHFPELLEKVVKLLEMHDEERLRMALRAKDTVNELFSPFIYLKELNQLYFGK